MPLRTRSIVSGLQLPFFRFLSKEFGTDRRSNPPFFSSQSSPLRIYWVVIADHSAVDNLSVLATLSTRPVVRNLSRILPTRGLGPFNFFAASSIEIGGPELRSISKIRTDSESEAISFPGRSPNSPISAMNLESSFSPSSSGAHSLIRIRALGFPSGGNSIAIATFFPLFHTLSINSRRCE